MDFGVPGIDQFEGLEYPFRTPRISGFEPRKRVETGGSQGQHYAQRYRPVEGQSQYPGRGAEDEGTEDQYRRRRAPRNRWFGTPKSGPRTPKMTHFGRSRSVPDHNTEDARMRTDGGYRKGPPREHIRYTSRMGCGPGAIRDSRIGVPWVGTHEGSNLEVQIPRIQGLGTPFWRS